MEIETLLILLKDLCARLPYGVVCQYNCVIPVEKRSLVKTNAKDKLKGIIPMPNGHIGFMVGIDKIDALEGDIKPYLRPLSSMTDEECKLYDEAIGKDNEALMQDNSEVPRLSLIPVHALNFLLSRHFDFRGLIDMGLALEAPVGMYKIE